MLTTICRAASVGATAAGLATLGYAMYDNHLNGYPTLQIRENDVEGIATISLVGACASGLGAAIGVRDTNRRRRRGFGWKIFG